MANDDFDLSDTKKPRRVWPWIVGGIFFLVMCDDDDEPRRSSNCYDFEGGETLCFEEPLPPDQYCYLVADNIVQCFETPLSEP